MKEMVYKTERQSAEVLYEGTYGGYNFVIVSYGTHPCAYVEIPKTSEYYGVDYDKLDFINCHYGLTYADRLDHIYPNNDRWFIGWDYAHAGDYMGYDVLFNFDTSKDKKWTTQEIYEEVKKVIDQIVTLDNKLD